MRLLPPRRSIRSSSLVSGSTKEVVWTLGESRSGPLVIQTDTLKKAAGPSFASRHCGGNRPTFLPPRASKTFVLDAQSAARTKELVEPNTRTYHRQVGARRHTEGQSGAERGRAGRDAHGSVRLGDNHPPCLPNLPNPKPRYTLGLSRRHDKAYGRKLSREDADRTVHQGCKCPAYPLPVESKTRTYHGRVASGRTAGWRGGVGQDCSPIELCA